MAELVDLRSDTVTRPSAGMRKAMAEAEVGDDVYAEDPTVRALEERTAELFGHEAALFVPSGTMGNQIGMRLVCEPGQEVLCDADAHVVTYEMGAAAAIFGISTRTVVSSGGRLDAQALIDQVRPKTDWHLTATAAVAVENSHNRGGGLVQPLDELQKLWNWSREAEVAVHLDGARIWNAHVASGVPLSTYGGLADTASVCFSKGLGTPVGSVLVASAERIATARLWRKRLGGGLVQPLDELQKLWNWSREAEVAVHLDGARIWNAHVASGVPLSTYGGLADTASVCFSKGLGTPVGSVLVASAERIAAARLWRKRLGGGMRQVGVLAAACLYALDHNLGRLGEDHEHAQVLAKRLGVDPATVATNMVVLDDVNAPVVAEAAKGQGVLVSQVSARRIRLVTHLDVDRAAIDRAADVLSALL